ncbi:MAG: thiamine phosphate synthase, partial [Akkermansia sp.]|nr:thiamine phosphate synthase [Akkermansia sp.]
MNAGGIRESQVRELFSPINTEQCPEDFRRAWRHDLPFFLKGRFTGSELALSPLCKKYGVPFVINDNVDIAIACGADGVHVGQSDMETGDVRARLGDNKIIGVSVHNVKEAVTAQEHGADYLGVGAVFSTSTKLDADTTSFGVVKDICDAVHIPVVAIGGINENNILKLKG